MPTAPDPDVQPPKLRYKTPKEEYVAEMREELGSRQVRKLLNEGRKLPFKLPFKDVLACLEAADTERNKLIIRVLYASGTRREEASCLQVEDLNVDDCGIFIRDSKYGKDRYVIIDQTTMAMLQEYIRYMDRSRSLFDLSGKQIWRIVKTCGEKSGVAARFTSLNRHFGPHAFRHAYATNLFENGMEAWELQWQMGHDHLETTRLYVHLSLDHVRQIYNQTHNFALFNAAGTAGTPAPLAAAVRIVQKPRPRLELVRSIANQLFEDKGDVQGAD